MRFKPSVDVAMISEGLFRKHYNTNLILEGQRKSRYPSSTNSLLGQYEDILYFSIISDLKWLKLGLSCGEWCKSNSLTAFFSHSLYSKPLNSKSNNCLYEPYMKLYYLSSLILLVIVGIPEPVAFVLEENLNL